MIKFKYIGILVKRQDLAPLIPIYSFVFSYVI